MDPKRWQRVQELFHQALEQPPDLRDIWLSQISDKEQPLVAEVRALLKQDADPDAPLDQGIGELANAVFEGTTRQPTQIGPYEILELIGEGGMGTVYKARRSDLDSVVAIKFLRDARFSPQRRARFLQEQRILAKVDHPGICKLYDAGMVDEGTPYFVMEYIDGLPLVEHCDRFGLGLEERLALFTQVAEAVRHAHRQMLIHRDLKPSNILVRKAAHNPSRVTLLDFGIAKETLPDANLAKTQTGLQMLTPAYAAPEQLNGEDVGTYSDVYSLGVILYELLTGCLPFRSLDSIPGSLHELMRQEPAMRPSARALTFERAPAFVGRVSRRDWSDLDVLCLTALQHDPARRYVTVDALLEDLDRFRRREPLKAQPDRWSYRASKFIQRNRKGVAATTAGLLIVASLLAFYTWRLAEARDQAQAEARRTQRIQRFTLDLFRGGDALAGPRQGLDVRTLIERGILEAESLDGEPEIQAEMFHTLGTVLHQLKDLPRARELLERAALTRAGLGAAGMKDSLETRLALAALTADEGDYVTAGTQAREVLAGLRSAEGAQSPRVASAQELLGSVLASLDRHDEAFELLEGALAIRESSGDSGAHISSLGALADAHFYAGNYEDSDRLNRERLALARLSLGEGHPTVATCLVNLAATRRWLGYPAEAETLFAEALEINEAFYGRRHPVVASNLSLLGTVMASQEKYAPARELLNEALKITEQFYGGEHVEVALALNKLAGWELSQGNLDAAAELYQRELDIYLVTYGEEHSRTAAGWSNLASIQFRRGDGDRAEQLMRQAVAAYGRALKTDHVDLAMARVKLGQLLVEQAKHREALAPLKAGLAVLEAQTSPALAWISVARSSLATCFSALGDDAQAAEYQALLEEDQE